MVEFLDPRASVGTEYDLYDLARDIRVDDGSGITVGLLANGFPDSELFLAKIGDALRRRLDKVSIKLWNKGNAGVPASEEMQSEITSSCQAVIVAYGH